MPRKTEDYIRLDAPGEVGKHEGHKIRTRTFSKKDGIKALYCVDCKKHTVYLFSRKPPWNWTMSRAQAWLKKRKKASFAGLSESGEIIFEHFNEKGALVEAVDQEKLKQEAEKMSFDKELRDDRIIFLFSHIGDFEAEDICKRLLVYDKLDSEKPVKLLISSFGGSVYSSFAITDMIEFVQCPVETIGIGKIMSGGLLIFMAGDKRYISQTASILSHRFSTMKMGSQAELKADQREDELVHKRMIDHYIKFSNLEDKKEVESKLLKQLNVWLTPEQVLEYELADDYFDKDWNVEEGMTEAVKDTVFGEAEVGIPLKDFEYLLHHVEVDEDGKEEIHHCYIYDHIANLFEHDHLLVKGGKAYLNGKVIKDELFHVIKGLEPDQEAVWSDKEAKEGKIKPKQMKAGMTIEEKAKEW